MKDCVKDQFLSFQLRIYYRVLGSLKFKLYQNYGIYQNQIFMLYLYL